MAKMETKVVEGNSFLDKYKNTPVVGAAVRWWISIRK